MKDTIINLLKETSRTGIIELIDAMEEGGFFGRMWDFVMMKFHQWFGSWFS